MKTIEIFLPADNINLTASDGFTLITYSGVYEKASRKCTVIRLSVNLHNLKRTKITNIKINNYGTCILFLCAICAILRNCCFLQIEKGLHTLKKKLKNKTEKDFTQTEKRFVIWHVLYFVWAFFGLITFQWYAFVFYISLSLLHISKSKVVELIDNVLSILTIIFIILNAYHFRIYLTL